MNTLEIDQPTYAERTGKAAAQAEAVELEAIGQEWKRGEKLWNEVGEKEIELVNVMYRIGQGLQRVSNREQLSFEYYRRVKAALPKNLTFDAARKCVHVARKLEKPAETIEDARRAQQMVFEAFGESSAPKRQIAQTPHVFNPWNHLASQIGSLTSLFARLDDRPMEEWDKGSLQKFVRETAPVAEQHRKAAELLKN